MKILAVDDEPLFLDVLNAALQQRGYQATTVTSGSDALNALDSSDAPFDCFLFDIQMPVMDGIELTRRVRARAEYRRTPITMITRVTERLDIEDAFGAGATDYITKPLDRLEFGTRLRLIEQLVEQNQLLAKAKDESKSRAEPNTKPMHDFDEPRLFSEVGGMIDFLALENYVLTLTRSEIIGCSALGISIENITSIYQRASAKVFEAVLQNVATVILDQLKRQHFLFSHVGGGDFVCLLSRFDELDAAELEVDLQCEMDEFEAKYAEKGLPVPSLHVGEQISKSMFSFGSSSSLLIRAIQSAQSHDKSSILSWNRRAVG
ncbi:MAG: response regulator [Rhodobacteraceae bacterium]|nr:response regulator [Paracoccaceae bacterium]